MSQLVVGERMRITLHFALKLENGDVVDSTFDKSPASFDYGDDNLPQAFSELLLGMKAGDKNSFTVTPEKAFGQRNPNNIQQFKRDQFAEDMPLELGMIINFQDAAKAEVPGVVKEVSDDQVTIDFNHPLAGEILIFDAEIINVEEAPMPVNVG